MARLVFKTSRAVQPTAWKVRFLRRPVLLYADQVRLGWTAGLVSVLVAATLASPNAAAAGAPSSVPTGASPCDREATRGALRAYFTAFDAGDFARLEALFAAEPAFQWYSTPGPGARLGAAAKRRDTLLPYLRRRHAKGDRLELSAFHWTGNAAHWSNFWFEGRKRTPAVAGGWFRADGKGAAVCESGAARIIVLTFGERA